MTTPPISPYAAAKRSTCPVCAAELLPARAMAAPFRRHARACRFSCGSCLSVVRVREQHHRHVADVEVPGSVVVRRLHALRDARAAGRVGAELEMIRESRPHRVLLRVPELFVEVRPFFRERARLAVDVRFSRVPPRPVLERFEGELPPIPPLRSPDRWTCTPFPMGSELVMPAGWSMGIAGVEGTFVVLKPHVTMGAGEPRPLPSPIAGLLAPLDVLAPEDGVW